MTNALQDSIDHDYARLCGKLETPMRVITRRATRVWFNRDRLDQLLASAFASCPHCDLLYAIDVDGRQVSSNIHVDSIDPRAYRQDLSRRPYAVSLSMLHNAAFQGVFPCNTYISRVTGRPCVTMMRGVTAGPTALGFIAADLDPSCLSTT